MTIMDIRLVLNIIGTHQKLQKINKLYFVDPKIILNARDLSNLNLGTMFGLILFYKITQIEQ